MNLLSLIKQQIQEKGELAFVDFMQLALYTPNFGYYSSALKKFGVQGDFITAPELTPLFGETLAYQCQQILSQCPKPALFEFGAGSGRLSVSLLEKLEQLASLPEHYYILELSAHLRQQQQALIKEKLPELVNRVHWLNSWPQTPFNGVVIANEVLDAFPVHRFLQTKEALLESFIRLDSKDQLVEIFKGSTNSHLQRYLDEVLPKELSPYQSEANLLIEGWLKQCYTMLNQGLVLLIDYGFPRHEYYHPDRSMGSLMCHYRHQAHTNPLIHVGEQDITAHVDFTQVAEAAVKAGFSVAGYTNQASFLLANGLLNLLEHVPSPERLQAQQAVKCLLQPNEMGELFKVIALSKNLTIPLTGFQLHDKRASL